MGFGVLFVYCGRSYTGKTALFWQWFVAGGGCDGFCCTSTNCNITITLAYALEVP